VTSMVVKVMGKNMVSNMPTGVHCKKSFIM
jgi:hypothetical protein